jgi:glycosyltransferase involved in cell wall biosynthesis
MKPIIMIAYFFPPEGNAGTYRPLRFMRHLSSMGWSPSIITLETNCYERYDPSLLSWIPEETEVLRVRSRDLWQAIQSRRSQRLQERLSRASLETVVRLCASHQRPVRSFIRGIVRTAEGWCYHPDMAMGWIRPATKATLNLCARRQPNVIWATAGPVSSFIVAQQVSHCTGVPYVLDFRDAWTVVYNEFDSRRPAWATRSNRRTMYRLLKGAQAVVFRYHTEAECYWRAYHGALEAARIHIIPNGYDGLIENFLAPDGDKCTVLYTGTLSSYRFDTFLQGLYWFKKSDPARAKHLHFLFIGESTEAFSQEVAALDLSDIVTTVGPTSHAEITRRQQEAHAFLVLGRPPTMKGYELLAGAKLFEYLKVGRPIVGVLPADETRRILRSVGVSTIAAADSPYQIAAVIRQLVDAWSEGTLSQLIPDRTACEAYSAERQTAALVRALDGVEAADPFVPGSVDIPPSLRLEIADG